MMGDFFSLFLLRGRPGLPEDGASIESELTVHHLRALGGTQPVEPS